MTDSRTIHLVDDDELLRAFAEHTLTAAGYAVRQHVSGLAFVEAIEGLEPGCVLLDIHMPGMSGFEVLDTLAARGVAWPVVVLTSASDYRAAVQAMKQGAFEFIQKPYAADALLEAMRAAFQRLDATSEEAAAQAKARALIAGLTARELQVLQGMLAGLPNKLIAYELDLSVRTVEIYRGKVMDKLQVRGLSSAIRLALGAGVEPLTERDEAGRDLDA